MKTLSFFLTWERFFFSVKSDLPTRVQYRVRTALGLRVLKWMDKRPLGGKRGAFEMEKEPETREFKK